MKSNWKNENSLDRHTQWMPLHFAFCVAACDFLRLAEMVKYWPVSAGREQTYGRLILLNSWCFIVFKEEIDVKEKVTS